jgi:hypothetical protein
VPRAHGELRAAARSRTLYSVTTFISDVIKSRKQILFFVLIHNYLKIKGFKFKVI